MLKKALLSLHFVFGFEAIAQKDYSGLVKSLYSGTESTALSIYNTSPESPDGKYICFVKYPAIAEGGHLAPPVRAEVMLKSRRTGDHVKIRDVTCNNHNGANAFWINDSLVAFQVSHFKDFEIYNVNSGKSVFGIVAGELGHKSFGNVVFYSKCNARLLIPDKSRTPYKPMDEGIYAFDCLAGRSTLIIKQAQIVAAFKRQNKKVSDYETKILHLEPNPLNSKIMFDYRYRADSASGWHDLHGIVSSDGSEPRWIKVRPMHVVWYDNQHMMGVDTEDPENRIFQYDLFGKRGELLGGTSTHVGMSPDKKWYIGEGDFYKSEADGFTRVYLYKQGESRPYALLAQWKNAKVTWEWVAHVNPSFSSDGKRAYFIRAFDHEDKFESVTIQLPEFD
ncbi:hypothetical protein [Dyadobacter sp. 32]|uniref:hypothetical protein n=1 Tax=Dyadobacter sp. 32 TaxID=538966 RepID=UPI0039C6DBBD